MNPEESICEGDSELHLNFLNLEDADAAFDSLKREVRWNAMHHRGGEVPRLVAVEGEILEEGSFPIYRHPADSSPPLLPFSPTVSRIRDAVQQKLGHPVNHVLIQLYRSGGDSISEHTDKTIDVVRSSRIVNVSLGAQRTMTLRTKKDAALGQTRTTQRVPLPHNSMFVLGLRTNERWLHAIRRDQRPSSTKSAEELAFGGARISLTFRQIGTFLTSDEILIFGQGATGKSRAEAKPVVYGATPQAEELIIAFGEENHRSEFDWEKYYGAGSDALHLTDVAEKSHARWDDD